MMLAMMLGLVGGKKKTINQPVEVFFVPPLLAKAGTPSSIRLVYDYLIRTNFVPGTCLAGQNRKQNRKQSTDDMYSVYSVYSVYPGAQ